MSANIKSYIALAESNIFFGEAPAGEAYLLPDKIREALKEQLNGSLIKTEVFIFEEAIRDEEKARVLCENRKGVRRGEYCILGVEKVDLC